MASDPIDFHCMYKNCLNILSYATFAIKMSEKQLKECIQFTTYTSLMMCHHSGTVVMSDHFMFSCDQVPSEVT